jgi:hypothetical protein
MSEYALLTGIQTYLRTFNMFDDTNCSTQVNEKPPASVGDFYVTIHMLNVQPSKYDDSEMIEEVYTFGITVSKRIKAVPEDKLPEAVYLETANGLSKICRFIVAALHHRASPIITANTLLTAEDDADYLSVVAGERFVNTPTWLGTSGQPELRNEEWFHGTYNTRNSRIEPFGFVGMTKTIRFRVTKVTSQKAC